MNGIQIDGFLEGGVIEKKVKSYEAPPLLSLGMFICSICVSVLYLKRYQCLCVYIHILLNLLSSNLKDLTNHVVELR
jgi:hypothetical protein